MASTYTTNLGIEKIGTGEQSGTWGGTTNTNWDLTDEAINGIISVTLSSAGSSGSPTALPITDGASSNGRNKFIEFALGVFPIISYRVIGMISINIHKIKFFINLG